MAGAITERTMSRATFRIHMADDHTPGAVGVKRPRNPPRAIVSVGRRHLAFQPVIATIPP